MFQETSKQESRIQSRILMLFVWNGMCVWRLLGEWHACGIHVRKYTPQRRHSPQSEYSHVQLLHDAMSNTLTTRPSRVCTAIEATIKAEATCARVCMHACVCACDWLCIWKCTFPSEQATARTICNCCASAVTTTLQTDDALPGLTTYPGVFKSSPGLLLRG